MVGQPQLASLTNWTPILMYHEVLPDSSATLPPHAVTQSALRAVLADFKERGYSSTSLEAAFGRRPGAPGRRFVITFDDGTADFLDGALPVLAEFGFSATLFVVSDLLGGRRNWSAHADSPPLDPVPLLSAAQLRELHRAGFEIGSHSCTHRRLPQLRLYEAVAEIMASRLILADVLGEPVNWFAYPYLAAGEREYALARKAGYSGACGGPNRRHHQLYLNRIEPALYSLPELRLRCSGLFHRARQLIRTFRYDKRRDQPLLA